MSSWLRRNRWGLLGLPLAASLAVTANAQRLPDYWWNTELRHAGVTGSEGQWTTWSDTFTDAAGEGTRTVTVKVASAEPTDSAESRGEIERLDLPADIAAIRVSMDFQADADQVLFGCRLALIDEDGNRYVYRPTVGTVTQDMWPCLRTDQTGPRPSISAGEPRTAMLGEARPPQWTTQPAVLVPRDARLTQVLLWWEEPDYLAVELN